MQSVSENQESIPKKRRPGRPTNRPEQPKLTLDGIVSEPNDPNNLIEFVYHEPLIFKNLFTYFKNLKAKEIHIRFTKTDITFFTRDHSLLSRVIVKIDCKKVNWYYCSEEIWIGLNRDRAEKMFTNIDKTFYRISVIYKKGRPDNLLLMFKDNDLAKECYYKIDISILMPDEDLFNIENEIPKIEDENEDNDAYPIQFTLGAKQFKKTISDTNSYSETISIEKAWDYQLEIKYNESSINYREVYKNPEKIKLVCNIKEGQNFQRTVRLANIKGLANSIVTDMITILCSNDSDLVLKSQIDENQTMTIYTFINCVI